MKGFKLGKDALIVSILTLLTVLSWIGFEVYRIATQSTIPEVTQEQMVSLNPKIKKEVVDDLKNNLWFEEEELNLNSSIVSTESAAP